MINLQREFRDIRARYFPRWDRGGGWRIRCDGRLRSDGLCEPSKSLITIQAIHPDRTSLTLLVIHEIAHAVAGCGHGKRWQKRLLAAADRAQVLGESGLAAGLRDEVAAYVQSASMGSGSAAHAYGNITDAVMESESPAPYPAVVDAVARDFGVKAKDFMVSFPRARKVYDQAIKERARDQAARRRFEESRLAAV